MKIKFAVYATEKIRILRRHGVKVTKGLVGDDLDETAMVIEQDREEPRSRVFET